jgi:hypothetical protein
LSRVLDVPVSFFFDDMSADVSSRHGALAAGMAESGQVPFQTDALAKRETLELVRAYYRITNPQIRKKVAELVKTMAATESEGESGRTPPKGSGRR